MKLRPFRRSTLVFLFVTVSIVTLLIYRSRLLFGLLLEDGSPDALDPSDIFPDISSPSGSARPQLIPKIIHQTWVNESIPIQWQAGQQAVKDLHSDWEYILWTDGVTHTFIETTYPEYLELFDSYPHAIQRADALRYFVLHHYGGIYLDLDISPFRALDPLLQFPAFACRTVPTGISNDVLGSRPGHPFFKLVINNLGSYKKNWVGSKYITVMYTTGPLFLSAIWVEYVDTLKRKIGIGQDKKIQELDRVRVLVDNKGDNYGFFNNMQGGSWHGRDMELIFWMGRHAIVVTLAGFVIGFTVTGLVWWVIRRVARFWERERWREIGGQTVGYRSSEDSAEV